MQGELRIIGLPGIPEVLPSADLPALLMAAAQAQVGGFENGDVLVVTQKVVSKAESRLVDLTTVTPSPFAEELARNWNKDPRLVELVLRESRRTVRMDQGVIITETKHGFVCANSGIDQSNVPGDTVVSLLPEDPDASARGIRDAIKQRTGADVGVIVSDTFGRPWRMGNTDIALGVAGISPLLSYVGQDDPYGYRLRVSVSAIADELASAAELVMGKVSGVPAALVRGYEFTPSEGSARSLVRSAERDLFR